MITKVKNTLQLAIILGLAGPAAFYSQPAKSIDRFCICPGNMYGNAVTLYPKLAAPDYCQDNVCALVICPGYNKVLKGWNDNGTGSCKSVSIEQK